MWTESRGIAIPQLTLLVYNSFDYLCNQVLICLPQVFKVAHLKGYYVQLSLIIHE